MFALTGAALLVAIGALGLYVWRATMGKRPYPRFAWENYASRNRDDD
jgi:hypothetical protein